MRKIKMILAVIIMAVLAISCNNPSSLAKDYESALKKKDFEKAAKVIEKAAEKYPSWSSKEQDDFIDAIEDATRHFTENCSGKTFEKFLKVTREAMDKLDDAIWNDDDDDDDDDEEEDDDDWGDDDEDEDW